MAYDSALGKIKFATVLDQAQENVGYPLEQVGSSALPGEMQAQAQQLVLPLYGGTAAAADSAIYLAGIRQRRQVRSLMNNVLCKLGGIYFRWNSDPELNGWLMIGAGTVEVLGEAVGLGQFQLNLQDCYRIATLRTHRNARRIEQYDRRLASVPRDYRGKLFSTDYAAQPSAPIAYLPVGAQNLYSLSAGFLGGPDPGFSLGATRMTRDGFAPYLLSRTHGETVMFDQIETNIENGQVRVFDRRGFQDTISQRYTNLVTNPSFETGTSGWSTSGTGLNSGATLTKDATAVMFGTSACKVVTTAASTQQGTRFVFPGTFVAGVTYSCSVWFSTNSAILAGNVRLGFGAPGDFAFYDQNSFGGGSGNFTLLTARWTPTATVTGTAFMVLQQNFQAAATWWIDGAICVQAANVPPYFDGSCEGCQWVNNAHGSVSTGPWAFVNRVQNPSAETNTTGWNSVANGVLSRQAEAESSAWEQPGTYAFRADTFAAGDGIAISNMAMLHPASSLIAGGVLGPPVSPSGATYAQTGMVAHFFAQIRAWQGSDVGKVVNVMFDLYDAAGNQTDTVTVTAVLRADWQNVGARRTIPVGATSRARMRFVAANNDQPSFLVDDCLIMTRGDTANRDNSYPPVLYFDGDQDGANWQGTPHGSVSLLWDDLENYGWEAVYGTDYPLSDLPVIENGIVRLSPHPVGSGVYRLEVFEQNGWFRELGAIEVRPDGNTGWILYDQRVVEWTPERAVVKYVLINTSGTGGTVRSDVFVTLQRGWTGPKVDVYTSKTAGTLPTDLICFHSIANSGLDNYAFMWGGYTTTGISALEPTSPSGHGSGTARQMNNTTPNSATLSPALFTTGKMENWAMFQPSADYGVSFAFFSQNDRAESLRLSSVYGPTDAVACMAQGSGQSAFTVQLGVCRATAGVWEAESFLGTDGSTTGTEASAFGGTPNYVTNGNVASPANPSVSIPASEIQKILPVPNTGGRMAVWARARVNNASNNAVLTATHNAVTTSGASGPGTSTAYVWVYLGEFSIARAQPLDIRGWISSGPGGGAILIDRVVALPTQRSAGATLNTFAELYDAARDLSTAALWDCQPKQTQVPRTL